MLHQNPSKDRMFIIEKQIVRLDKLNVEGRILDIGGGGEGVIGQVCGESVVAIDRDIDELKEAHGNNLKIVMDARELKFLDNSFDTVTSFFTMMYIGRTDHQKVFQEIHRIIKPEGKFLLWDVIIPEYDGGKKDIFVVPLKISFNDKEISTAYGVNQKKRKQDLEYFIGLGRETGFKVLEQSSEQQHYFLIFKK